MKTHYCKKCGKEFQSEKHNKICEKCYSKIRKTSSLNGWENEEALKTYWNKRKGKLRTHTETKPKWDNIETFDPSTIEPCSTCGNPHFSKEEYNHEYTKEYYVTGITIQSIPELLKEYEKTKNKKEFLERRGLI